MTNDHEYDRFLQSSAGPGVSVKKPHAIVQTKVPGDGWVQVDDQTAIQVLAEEVEERGEFLEEATGLLDEAADFMDDLEDELVETEERRYNEHSRAEMYKAEMQTLQHKLFKQRQLRRREREERESEAGFAELGHHLYESVLRQAGLYPWQISIDKVIDLYLEMGR